MVMAETMEKVAYLARRLEGERNRLRDEIARARLAADHVERMHRIRTASDTFEASRLW